MFWYSEGHTTKVITREDMAISYRKNEVYREVDYFNHSPWGICMIYVRDHNFTLDWDKDSHSKITGSMLCISFGLLSTKSIGGLRNTFIQSLN